MKLADIKLNKVVMIEGITTHENTAFRLEELGLFVGKHVYIKNRQPMHGPLIVVVNNTSIALSEVIAKKIKVKEI